MTLSPIDQRFLDLMHRIETDQTREINSLRAQIAQLEARTCAQQTRIAALEDSLVQQAELWTNLNNKLAALLDPLDGSRPLPSGSNASDG